MKDTSFRRNYPLWVQFGLWGSPNRTTVWIWFWVAVGLALGSAVYGFWNPRFFYGLLFLLSALMYWVTIRWVDRNGQW